MRLLSQRAALAAACIASGLITAACATIGANSAAPASELTGTRWVALSIDGQPIASAQRPEIAFEVEDRVSGSTGCNRFFGMYEAEAGRIDVRALGQTERACEGDVMRQEAAFIAALRNAARYEHAAGQLTLIGQDGRTLTLRAPS